MREGYESIKTLESGLCVCWQQIYYVAPTLLENVILRQVLNENMLPISNLINECTIVAG